MNKLFEATSFVEFVVPVVADTARKGISDEIPFLLAKRVAKLTYIPAIWCDKKVVRNLLNVLAW